MNTNNPFHFELCPRKYARTKHCRDKYRNKSYFNITCTRLKTAKARNCSNF